MDLLIAIAPTDLLIAAIGRPQWETMNALRRVETARGVHRRPNPVLD